MKTVFSFAVKSDTDETTNVGLSDGRDIEVQTAQGRVRCRWRTWRRSNARSSTCKRAISCSRCAPQPLAALVSPQRLTQAHSRPHTEQNQVADLAGGREGSVIHEELLATRERLEKRDEDLLVRCMTAQICARRHNRTVRFARPGVALTVSPCPWRPARHAQAFEAKLGASKEEVRQLKQLLVKARGTISAYDARHAQDEAEQQRLAEQLRASADEADALRLSCEGLATGASAAHCAAEVLGGSLADLDGEYDVLLAAHRGYTAEMEATRQSSRRSVASGNAALTDATAEVARLRLDGSKLRGRVAALDTELNQLRTQLHARERELEDAAASAADATRSAAVLEVQLSSAAEQGADTAAQLARAHAELEARAAALAARSAELEHERALGEAAARKRQAEAAAEAQARAAVAADAGRWQQRCAALETQLAEALAGGGATRHALDEARARTLAAELAGAVQLRTLAVDFASMEIQLSSADERAQAELAAARARSAAEAAKAEREAVQRTQSLQAQLAKARSELEATERRLSEATAKLGTSAKHANQVRALQAHVSDLSDKLEKKSAMCERLLKRGACAFAPPADADEPAQRGAPSRTQHAAASDPELAADLPTTSAASAACRASVGVGRVEERHGRDKENLYRRASAAAAVAGGGARAPSAPRSSSRARSSASGDRPAPMAAWVAPGTDGRRASGGLALPARQSDRSVLTPRRRPAVDGGESAGPSSAAKDGAGQAPADCGGESNEAPTCERRKSGVRVIPSRYLDLSSNVTLRRR